MAGSIPGRPSLVLMFQGDIIGQNVLEYARPKAQTLVITLSFHKVEHKCVSDDELLPTLRLHHDARCELLKHDRMILHNTVHSFQGNRQDISRYKTEL